jgi:hypothetical protein
VRLDNKARLILRSNHPVRIDVHSECTDAVDGILDGLTTQHSRRFSARVQMTQSVHPLDAVKSTELPTHSDWQVMSGSVVSVPSYLLRCTIMSV